MITHMLKNILIKSKTDKMLVRLLKSKPNKIRGRVDS